MLVEILENLNDVDKSIKNGEYPNDESALAAIFREALKSIKGYDIKVDNPKNPGEYMVVSGKIKLADESGKEKYYNFKVDFKNSISY